MTDGSAQDAIGGAAGGMGQRKTMTLKSGRPPARVTGTSAPKGDAATPMMAQFLEVKAKHPDFMLFYRMGDFFELFFDDAVQAAQALGIQLTKRGKHLGEDIPMCGVPVARAEEYLHKLIRKGFRVAVAEQLEDPAEAKRRGGKSVVMRDVVRLVTPGTLTEDTLLSSGASNFLTALHMPGETKGLAALASLDLSTGVFLLSEARVSDLGHELARLSPAEVIVSEDLRDGLKPHLDAVASAAVAEVTRSCFSSSKGERALAAAFQVAAIDGLGSFSRGELTAIGALLHYVELTQIGHKPALRPPRRESRSGHVLIDAATRASLELVKPQNGDGPTVLSAMDRTKTAAGARELAARLSSPLCDAEAINRRLDAVAFFHGGWPLRAQIRKLLAEAPDMARALSRLKLGRGSPRDLGAIRDGLSAAGGIHRLLCDAATDLPADIGTCQRAVQAAPSGLAETLRSALMSTLPLSFAEGQVIAGEYSEDLAGLRRLSAGSKAVLAELQAEYAAQTGIKSLKIQYNNIFGYFIEVGANAAETLRTKPHDATFRHRQTLANAVRFVTDKLSDLESRILSAAEKAQALERRLFDALVHQTLDHEREIGDCAEALASLDCAAALAELAEEQGYVRPTMDDSAAFRIEGGRHPVVEQALKGRGESFIANDCMLSGEPADAPRLLIVTGPNMAGKSTFLRQNALIAVLAQMGSFVPAQAAHIGVLDRLFSRVGASDELARGRSTFMVEMIEAAAILNQATDRSFVVLDEIGRGTATFDGLSIAWAALEHLHDVTRCRGLFATHYHELTRLPETLSGAANVTVAVKEWKDDIVFLHSVEPGAAGQSYGIQVAKLAGVPQKVIARAKEILARLEGSPHAAAAFDALNDLPLFQMRADHAYVGGGFAEEDAQAGDVPPEARAVLAALADLDPDSLSPREALEALYELKRLGSDG